jgi:hypothetical protein
VTHALQSPERSAAGWIVGMPVAQFDDLAAVGRRRVAQLHVEEVVIDILSGFLAEFDKAMVVHNDVAYLGEARREALTLTLDRDELNVAEIFISGYDDDPRSLYEVPEVRRWFKTAHDRWPDITFWLAPDSLRTAALSLNPSMWSRVSDGRLRIEFDTEVILDQFVADATKAFVVVVDAGMSEASAMRAAENARENVQRMFDQLRYGDYAVVHPEDGAIRKYRK